jgi:hypothetical protein
MVCISVFLVCESVIKSLVPTVQKNRDAFVKAMTEPTEAPKGILRKPGEKRVYKGEMVMASQGYTVRIVYSHPQRVTRTEYEMKVGELT